MPPSVQAGSNGPAIAQSCGTRTGCQTSSGASGASSRRATAFVEAGEVSFQTWANSQPSARTFSPKMATSGFLMRSTRSWKRRFVSSSRTTTLPRSSWGIQPFIQLSSWNGFSNSAASARMSSDVPLRPSGPME